jgi:Spy/CpxP family protein refolding chaperone
MFGFLVGTVSLIALVKVLRGGGRWGHHAGGYGQGRRRWMLRFISERLGATPGQEKVIQEVIDEVEAKGRAVREEISQLRTNVAKAMRGETFDTAQAREAMDKQQTLIDELRAAAVAGMQKIHEALDPEQRKRVGDLLEFGPRYASGGYGGCGGGRFGRHHGGGFGGGRYASGNSGAVNL